MDKGIYVSLLPKGKIKRTLTTESGEVELPETTIADEIILFSELDFEHYAQVVELLNTIADAIPSPPKNLTQEEINAYDLLLDTTEDLVTTLEQEDLLCGTLTRTLLLCHRVVHHRPLRTRQKACFCVLFQILCGFSSS